MSSSPFKQAKPVQTRSPRKEKKVVESIPVEGLESLSALDTVIKALTLLKTTMSDSIKTGPMTDYFVEKGTEKGTTPDNFRGLDGVAIASLEMRIRAVTATLNDDEQILCGQYGIPMVKNSETLETFVFNPAYLTDADLMMKIEKALKRVKGLPDDIIQRQPGKTSYSLSKDALNVLFTKDKKVVRDLLPTLSTMAIKPVQDVEDVGKAFKKVYKMFVPSKPKKAKVEA